MSNLTMTDLINRSLSLVKHSEFLSSIDDNSELARQIRSIYPQVLTEVQSEYDWKELIVTEELIALENETLSRWEVPVPSDLLRVVFSSVDYVIEGNMIIISSFTNTNITDDSRAFTFKYTRQDNNPYNWSPQLVKWFVYAMAIELPAFTVVDQNILARLSQQLKFDIIPRARYVQEHGRAKTSYRPKGRRYQHRYGRGYRGEN